MSDYVEEVKEDNFEPLVLQSKRPVVVDFWAEWCAPCRALAPIVQTIAKQYAGSVHVFKLDVDDNPSITQRYAIQGIPTLILFKGGKEQERIVGVCSAEAISRMIASHIGALKDKAGYASPRKVG